MEDVIIPLAAVKPPGRSEDFCDCTVFVGPEKKPFRTHRFLLAAASDLFRDQLLSSRDKPEAVLELPEFSEETISNLISSLYNGSLQVPGKKTVRTIKEAAEPPKPKVKYLAGIPVPQELRKPGTMVRFTGNSSGHSYGTGPKVWRMSQTDGSSLRATDPTTGSQGNWFSWDEVVLGEDVFESGLSASSSFSFAAASSSSSGSLFGAATPSSGFGGGGGSFGTPVQQPPVPGAFSFGAAATPAPSVFGAPAPAARPLTAGMRVRRGPAWSWGDQDGGSGTIGTVEGPDSSAGWFRIRWPSGSTFNYRYNASQQDLEIVDGPAASAAVSSGPKTWISSATRLPVAGDVVRRGRDWKWGNQDGGVGSTGTIVGPGSSASWWRVQWANGSSSNSYRYGAEGSYDLEIQVAANESDNSSAASKFMLRKEIEIVPESESLVDLAVTAAKLRLITLQESCTEALLDDPDCVSALIKRTARRESELDAELFKGSTAFFAESPKNCQLLRDVDLLTSLSPDMLLSVLTRPDLPMTETEIFEVAAQWCSLYQGAANSNSKKALPTPRELFAQVRGCIQFDGIGFAQCREKIAPSGLLNAEEIVAIYAVVKEAPVTSKRGAGGTSKRKTKGKARFVEEEGEVDTAFVNLFKTSKVVDASKDGVLLTKIQAQIKSKGGITALPSANLLFSHSAFGSVPSWNAACQKRENTLTIIRLKDGRVLGGFSAAPWRDVVGMYPDPRAFIFTLQPKFSVKTCKETAFFSAVGSIASIAAPAWNQDLVVDPSDKGVVMVPTAYDPLFPDAPSSAAPVEIADFETWELTLSK